MTDVKENVIEWITGQDWMGVTLTQRKYITKVRKLRNKQPELVPVYYENTDGSIYCHLPLKALKLYVKTGGNQAFGRDDDESEEDDE